jgi:hypothetical protein
VVVPFVAADVVLAPKLEALHELVASRELLHAASAATGLRWASTSATRTASAGDQAGSLGVAFEQRFSEP